MNDELQTPTELGASISSDFEKSIIKGMNLDKDKRWQSVGELIDATKKVHPKQISEKEERKHKKNLKIALMAVILVIFAGGLLFFNQHRAQIKLRSKEKVVFYICPDEDMTAKQYKKSIKVIQKRVAAWAGRNNFLWQETDDNAGTIKITVPLELLYDKELPYVITTYLTKPMNIRGKTINGDFKIQQSDIHTSKIITRQLPMDIVEKAELSVKEEYSVVRCSFSQSLRKDMHNFLKDKGQILELYYDTKPSEYYETMSSHNYAITVGDGKSIDVISKDQESEYMELLGHDLTHKSFTGDYIVAYEPVVKWYKPSDKSMIGKHQTNENKIVEDSVLIEIGDMNYDVMLTKDQGNYAQVLVNLENRLDATGKPYALGEDPTTGNVIVKMSQQDIWSSELELLPAKSSWALKDTLQPVCPLKSLPKHKLEAYVDKQFDPPRFCLKLTDSRKEKEAVVAFLRKARDLGEKTCQLTQQDTGFTGIGYADSKSITGFVVANVDIKKALESVLRYNCIYIEDYALNQYDHSVNSFDRFSSFLCAVEESDMPADLVIKQFTFNNRFLALGREYGNILYYTPKQLHKLKGNFAWAQYKLAAQIEKEENVEVTYKPEGAGEIMAIIVSECDSDDFAQTVLNRAKEILMKYKLTKKNVDAVNMEFTTSSSGSDKERSDLTFNMCLDKTHATGINSIGIQSVYINNTTADHSIEKRINKRLKTDPFFILLNPSKEYIYVGLE